MKKLFFLLMAFQLLLPAAAAGNDALIKAVQAADLKAVTAAVESGADVNAVIPFDKTPVLTVSIYLRQNEIARYLISKGANLKTANAKGITPLIKAVVNNDLPMIQLLIEKGADINAVDSYKYNALQYALQYSASLDVVKYLVEKGSDIKKPNIFNFYPLFVAAGSGRPDFIHYLIEKGVNPNEVNAANFSALYCAAYFCPKPLEVMKALVEKGADIHIKITMDPNSILDHTLTMEQMNQSKNFEASLYLLSKGGTILPATATRVLPTALDRKLFDLAKQLILAKADVNVIENPKEPSPLLHQAVKNGNLEIVTLMLDSKAKVNAVDKDGQTALTLAAQAGNLEMVRLLLERKSPVNAKNKWGGTALTYAAASGNLEMVKLLVQNKADLKAGDLVYSEVSSGSLEMVKYFADLKVPLKGQKSSVLGRAAETGNLDLVRYLVENGLNVNDKDAGGRTVLHDAALSGNLELFQYLEGLGLDPKAVSSTGESTLFLASESGSIPLIKYLLSKGLDINAETDKGESILTSGALGGFILYMSYGGMTMPFITARNLSRPKKGTGINRDIMKFLIENGASVKPQKSKVNMLMHAAGLGDLEAVQYLIKKGASVLDRDAAGEDVLFYAVRSGQPKIVEILLKSGADPKIAVEGGNTALSEACFSGSLETVRLLVEAGADVEQRLKANNGQTPLMSAAYSGYADIVDYLIRKGAKVNAVKEDGWTALLIAIEGGNPSVIRLLVEAGADVNVKLPKSGTTPLALAQSWRTQKPSLATMVIEEYLGYKGAVLQ